jgi:large subunit ribosomal protein L23
VNTITMKSKPKRRGMHRGHTRSWKKAIIELKPGDRIEFFGAR